MTRRERGRKRPVEGGQRKRTPDRKREPRREVEKKAEAPKRARTVYAPVTPAPAAPPRVGDWLFTTRPGAEIDLVEEMVYTAPAKARPEPRIAGPALVAAEKKYNELAFARQGFPVAALVHPDALARAFADSLARTSKTPQPWALDVWVPDSDESNRLSALADVVERQAISALADIAPAWAAARVKDARTALSENGLYAQAALLATDKLAAGVLPARDAPSLAPGGRLRVHVPQAAPSRAAMKLAEAFLWLDRAPEPGELCVDLGAAPGGWSWVLLERRANVLAVDPARLAPDLMKRKGMHHLRKDAFTFQPDETVDWLFSDMAWRPLESAALLAKWARRKWARMLVANIKLPMRKKAEMLMRVREILTDGGWTNLRMRQLYHDREEVTVAGVRI